MNQINENERFSIKQEPSRADNYTTNSNIRTKTKTMEPLLSEQGRKSNRIELNAKHVQIKSIKKTRQSKIYTRTQLQREVSPGIYSITMRYEYACRDRDKFELNYIQLASRTAKL